MKLFPHIMSTGCYWLAYLKYLSLSGLSWFRSLFSAPKIVFEAEYNGQKILLLALYQKGLLRPGIMRLLSRAKDAGFYVVAINTRKLVRPHDFEGLIDCYIERFNHGRDFGSYKLGFLHLYSRQWEEQCPRLLMLNDSVYFLDKHMAEFLNVMSTTNLEVLGATENFEIEHHLGSFCISMSQSILGHKALRRFWRRFSLSNLRPRNIKMGEMRLTKTLGEIAQDDRALAAYYDLQFSSLAMKKSVDLIDFAYSSQARSPMWPRSNVGFPELFCRIKESQIYWPQAHFLEDAGAKEKSVSLTLQQAEIAQITVGSLTELQLRLEEIGIKNTLEDLSEFAVSTFSSAYAGGSQIHVMAPLLVRLGCPLIKLDLVYRGVMDHFDLKWLLGVLEPSDQSELQGLLMRRQYGGRFLSGLERAAFLRGLI